MNPGGHWSAPLTHVGRSDSVALQQVKFSAGHAESGRQHVCEAPPHAPIPRRPFAGEQSLTPTQVPPLALHGGSASLPVSAGASVVVTSALLPSVEASAGFAVSSPPHAHRGSVRNKNANVCRMTRA
jgi:hypothetical protein